MAAIHKLLTIEESTLLAMSTNPNFLTEFPFLKSLQGVKKGRGGCGKCGGGIAKRVQTVNGAKQTLISLGAEKKNRLKALLKAEKVRIRVASNGKVVDYTF